MVYIKKYFIKSIFYGVIKMKNVFLLLSFLFLFACGENNDKALKAEKENIAVSKVDKNQELRLFSQAEPKSLDVSRSTDTYSSDIFVLTNEGLVGAQMNSQGVEEVVPAGAESWEVSKDNLKWTFHLRKDAVWADGKPVTAYEYCYGIKRTLNPKVGSSYSFLLYPIKGAKKYNAEGGSEEEVGVKAIDDYTLEITLEAPTPYFLQTAYFKVMYPQRKDIVEKYGESYGSEGDQIMSNGPYILKSWVHNSEIVLEKNQKYWDKDNFKLDKIVLMVVTDVNSRMNLLASGQVDIGKADKPEWTDQFMKSGDFENIKLPALGTNYISFNQKSRYFKNAKVRKAVNLALDRAELNKVLFNGIYEPAYGFVPKGITIGGKEYRKEVVEPVKKIFEENKNAKALLVEGLKELGEDQNPANMEITFLASGTDTWFRKYVELLQQMLKTKLGINLKAEFVEWPVFQKRVDELEFEMSGQAWVADYNDPNTFLDLWISSSKMVPTGWGSKEYDELIFKAASTSDENVRIKAFSNAENILLYKDSVIAPILYRVNNYYARKYVKNYKPTVIASYNYKNVYIDGRK